MTQGSEEAAARRLQELVARLEGLLGELEQTAESEEAVDRLARMAELAREVQAEIERIRREGADALA